MSEALRMSQKSVRKKVQHSDFQSGSISCITKTASFWQSTLFFKIEEKIRPKTRSYITNQEDLAQQYFALRKITHKPYIVDKRHKLSIFLD